MFENARERTVRADELEPRHARPLTTLRVRLGFRGCLLHEFLSSLHSCVTSRRRHASLELCTSCFLSGSISAPLLPPRSQCLLIVSIRDFRIFRRAKRYPRSILPLAKIALTRRRILRRARVPFESINSLKQPFDVASRFAASIEFHA